MLRSYLSATYLPDPSIWQPVISEPPARIVRQFVFGCIAPRRPGSGGQMALCGSRAGYRPRFLAQRGPDSD